MAATLEMPELPDLFKAARAKYFDACEEVDNIAEDGYQAAADELDQLSQSVVRIVIDLQVRLDRDRRALLYKKELAEKEGTQAGAEAVESSSSLPAQETCQRVRVAFDKVVEASEPYLNQADTVAEDKEDSTTRNCPVDPEDASAPQKDMEEVVEDPVLPSPEVAYGRQPSEVVQHVITAHNGDRPGLLEQPPGLRADEMGSDQDQREMLRESMIGEWRNHEGKTYEITFKEDIPYFETCGDHGESLSIKLIEDSDNKCFWWGTHHFMDLADLKRKPNQIFWYDKADLNQQPRRASFAWKRPHQTPSAMLQVDQYEAGAENHRQSWTADQKWQHAVPVLSQRVKSKLPIWTGGDSENWQYDKKDNLVASLSLGHALYVQRFEDEHRDNSQAVDAEGCWEAMMEETHGPAASSQEYGGCASSSSDAQGQWSKGQSSYDWQPRKKKTSNWGSQNMEKQNMEDEVWNALGGTWIGHKSETYDVQSKVSGGSRTWTCVRHNSSGSKAFKLSWDETYWMMWWGNAYWLDAQELLKQPNSAVWCITNNEMQNKACFKWFRSDSSGYDHSEYDTSSSWQSREKKNKRRDGDTDATVFD